MDGVRSGVDPAAQAAAELAIASRLCRPTLALVCRGQTQVSAIAAQLQVAEDDARRALFALEAAGLVESSRYVATEIGRRFHK